MPRKLTVVRENGLTVVCDIFRLETFALSPFRDHPE